MSITVIVALELNSAEEIAKLDSIWPERWRAIEMQCPELTAETAKIARTLAFGRMAGAVVAHGWHDAWFVPGVRDSRGAVKRKWSAERTRRLFGECGVSTNVRDTGG